MRTRSYIRTAVLPFFAAAALPLTAAAQQTNDRAAQADAYFSQASQLELEQVNGFRQHLKKVAGLYMRSASLRPVEDPARIESLNRAGRLLYTI